jgi:hypothetical protein
LQQKQITTTLKEKHIAPIVLIHQSAFHLVSSCSSYLTICNISSMIPISSSEWRR